MNKKYPFQFSILQYVHDTFTEEFLNVGLAFYAPSLPYFNVKLLAKYRRLTQTFPSADGEHYRKYIVSMQTKFDLLYQNVNSGQISFTSSHPLKIEELLGTVLPKDDSSLRFGAVHGGMTSNLEETFNDFYHRFVEMHLHEEKEESRDESVIWHDFSKSLKEHNISHQLRSTVINTPQDDIEFDHAWKNGRWNALQPISFDLSQTAYIRRKSREWFSANVLLSKARDVNEVYYLLSKPLHQEASLMKAYQKAKDLLGTGEYSQKVKIIEENEAEDFAKHIAPRIIRDTAHE